VIITLACLATATMGTYAAVKLIIVRFQQVPLHRRLVAIPLSSPFNELRTLPVRDLRSQRDNV